MCKVVNTANRHTADRRDVRRERGEAACDRDESMFPWWMLDHVDRAQPSPQERIVVVDEVQRLLDQLPDDLRQIVVWKLEGFTNMGISRLIGKTVRSVEMKLNLIRKRLNHEIGIPDSDVESRAPRI
jgi:DNA-directed RNA polymerase specialized sigma24 family protein